MHMRFSIGARATPGSVFVNPASARFDDKSGRIEYACNMALSERNRN